MNWTNNYCRLYFEKNGRFRPSVDCWGLVRLVYLEQLGIELPLYGEISGSDFLAIARMVDDQRFQSTWRKKDDASAFDVVVMTSHNMKSNRVSRRNSHVGVMVDENRVMHIEDGLGVSIVPVSSPIVANRIVGFYEYIG